MVILAFYSEQCWIRSWARWLWSVNMALKGLRQEDCYEFQAGLGHSEIQSQRVNSRTFGKNILHHQGLILNRNSSNILVFPILLS